MKGHFLKSRSKYADFCRHKTRGIISRMLETPLEQENVKNVLIWTPAELVTRVYAIAGFLPVGYKVGKKVHLIY